MHEGRWKDHLVYGWRVKRRDEGQAGNGFVIGESIPFEITLVPLEKTFIHKIVAKLRRECQDYSCVVLDPCSDSNVFQNKVYDFQADAFI